MDDNITHVPEGFSSWNQWADFVLGRLIKMVDKEWSLWGTFDESKYDNDEIIQALHYARTKLL